MNAPIPGPGTHDKRNFEDSIRVSLIEEPLHCEQSGMPVLQLLAALRQYHQARDFSHQERFGKPDGQSRKALSELGRIQQSLQELKSGMGGIGEELFIEASLNVRVAPRI